MSGSAEGALHTAITAALRGVAGLNRVDPGQPVRTTPPSAELGPIAGSDWSTKDSAGREVRVTVTIRDLAEQPARLHALNAAAEAAVAALPRAVDGWRIASCVLLKNRVAGEKAGSWAAVSEWRIRVLAL